MGQLKCLHQIHAEAEREVLTSGSTSMEVRFAEQGDRDRVIALLRESHTAAGYTFPFQAARAALLFQQHMESPRACVIVIGRPAQGILLAVSNDHPFGAGQVAVETIWFVSERARGRGSLRMLDAYEAWAKSVGSTSIVMASMSINDVSGIYLRRGYTPIETHFLKHVRKDQQEGRAA